MKYVIVLSCVKVRSIHGLFLHLTRQIAINREFLFLYKKCYKLQPRLNTRNYVIIKGPKSH
nr:MAG TPA: hypothetical protein [Caudoviricetes sp.]